MSNISFDNPWLLFLALPLFAAVIVPFCVAVRRDNANAHNITAVILNLVICVCLTLVISGMTFETVQEETQVYVLADVSYSSEHNIDEVQKNVEKISKKLPKNSKMGVICFGRNYQLLSDIGEGVPDVSKATKVDKSATDIGSALRYAGNLFDKDVIKRIIVITDGAETVTNNNIVKVVNNLQTNGVYVDAVYLDDNLPDDVKEIQVDSIDASASSYIGKSEEVNVLVRANCGTNEDGTDYRIDGYVYLYRGEELVGGKPGTATFYDGYNTVTIPLTSSEAGTFDYKVVIEPLNEEDDFSPHNNVGYFTQNVSEDRKVLFIGGNNSDINAGKAIYGTEGVTYVTNVMDIPVTPEDLCVFDEIVINNFDLRTFRSASIFLDSVSMLVRDYGKTFTTYGNTYIQNKGVDDATGNAVLDQLQALLPVNIGSKDQDTRLITLVLDISTSMNTNSRYDVAIRAAKEILNVLSPTDTVMVIGFSGGVQVLQYPTKLTKPNLIISAIDKVTPENHTNLSNALTVAYENMPSRYRDKQVIIISDGMNPVSDQAAAVSMATKMSSESIAVSALGIYPTDYGDSLLEQHIVQNANMEKRPGFYQKIVNEKEIDFVINSIGDETSQATVENSEGLQVDVQRPTEDVLNGVEGLERITGVWNNYAKAAAKEVITVRNYKNKVDYTNVPLYAYWNGGGGNGKVVSFLSDISSEWISGWGSGTNGRQFLTNIPEATLPKERITTPFAVEVNREGNSTVITVKTSSFLQSGATFEVTLTDPKGFVNTKQLTYASGEYFATYSTDDPGLYSVHLNYTYNDVHYETDSYFSVSYYAEYDSFTSYSKSSLYKLLSDNGRILELDEVDSLENNDSKITTFIFDFTIPLIITAAVLFIIGVIVRQLRWKDVTSFFSGLGRRRK